jgi:hypothetical protein
VGQRVREGGKENELVNLIFFQVAERIGDIGDGG